MRRTVRLIIGWWADRPNTGRSFRRHTEVGRRVSEGDW
jgi:hypothetical protein